MRQSQPPASSNDACVICFALLQQRDFNAQPVSEGRCCAECYYTVVTCAMDAMIKSYLRT